MDQDTIAEHLRLDLETLRHIAASVVALAKEVDRIGALIESHIKEQG